MSKKSISIYIFIFIINPFLGMLSIVLTKMIVNKRGKKSDLLLFVFITVYACLLQSTRIWEVGQHSDWNEGYAPLFQDVGTTSAINYIFMLKEPAWNLINYIGYYLNDGSAFLFLNEVAIFTIYLTCYTIYIYWKDSNTKPIVLIASLFLIVFFVEYYSQLNNLLRQYFSLSIVMYAYVRKVTLNKSSWWLLLVASLIHTMSFIFLLFYMIRPLYQKIGIREIVRLFGYALLLVLIFNNIGFLQQIFAKIQFLNYAFERLSSATNPLDHNFLDPMTVTINASILIFISIIISMKSVSKSNIFLANISMVTMLLVISLATLAPEIMGRIYVSRFYLFPFILPYFLVQIKIFHNVYIYSLIGFFFYRFILLFDLVRGGDFFPPLSELLQYSILHFIL